MLSHKLIIPGALALLAGCYAGEVHNNKDLNQNMMDLRLYQENIGDYLEANRLEDASWLLEEMDSILLILNKRFPEHRRLNAPFAETYKKDMQPPIRGIRAAIRDRDTATALKHYRLLVDNCNDCHINNEVDKEVKY
jgi:hypothetical protein